MIRDCEEAGMPKYKLFASLGHCVVASDPPQKDRLPLLNSVSDMYMCTRAGQFFP